MLRDLVKTVVDHVCFLYLHNVEALLELTVGRGTGLGFVCKWGRCLLLSRFLGARRMDASEGRTEGAPLASLFPLSLPDMTF